jgi:hypothetical protein
LTGARQGGAAGHLGRREVPGTHGGSGSLRHDFHGAAGAPNFPGNTQKVLVGDLKMSVDRLIGHSVDLTETAKALKAYSVKSTKTAKVLKACSVKSTETVEVLRAYSVKSTKTVKALRAYSVKLTETAKVLRAYPGESKMSTESVWKPPAGRDLRRIIARGMEAQSAA